MPFGYQQITISGARDDTEGVALFIQEATTFLQSLGWSVEDDRTAEPATNDPALHHKMVMRSQGEANEYGTFYLTMFSGTSVGQNSNLVSFMMHTAYDSGAHDIPASGISTSSTDFFDANASLNTRSQEDFEVWMSGDSEGVVFVTRQSPSTYDSVMFGRLNQFEPTSVDSYPLYINTTSTAIVTVTNTVQARGIAGEPPKAFANNSEAEFRTYSSLNQFSQPYDLGAATSIYLATPILFFTDDQNPTGQGVIGTVRNAWAAVGTTAGILDEGTLTASGSEGVQIYRAFPANTTESLILRQS